MIEFSKYLITRSLWYLINFPNLFYLIHVASQTSFKLSLSEESQQFEWYALGPFLILVWILRSYCLSLVDCALILNILEAGFMLILFDDK